MGKVLDFGRQMADGMVSFVTGLGLAGKDKAATTGYILPFYTDADLATMYRASWLPRKIVNIPAFDAVRRWRNWDATPEQILAIEAEEARLQVKRKMFEAMVKARLFGWCALYISTGAGNPALPLSPVDIKKGGIRFLNVMTKNMLTPGDREIDPESEYFDQPLWYTLANSPEVRIHPSRLVIFKGEPLPDETLTAGSQKWGWGDSVLISCLSAIKNVDATAANIASLVFEAKVDIIKVPQLMDYMTDQSQEQNLMKRFSLANILKGNNAMLLLDSEEEHEQKTQSFTNLPEILQQFMILVSGAADIPATRLFGQAPAGMNATGESDLRNYYDRVASMQSLEIDPAMSVFNETLIQSALGSRPPEIFVSWASLWQLSDKEKADIGKTNADTLNVLNNTGLFPQEALGKAGINLLVESGLMPGFDQDVEEVGGLPDYELEAQKEAENAIALAQTKAANANSPRRQAVGDATPKTLYIRRDVVNAGDITAWAKGQGFETVQADLHVTIIHTRSLVDWIKVGNASEFGENADGQLVIAAGGPRLMERFGDAVVLQFASARLTWRHMDIKDMGAETDFPEYQPHITITWELPASIDLNKIEPYKGEIILGPEIFEEVNDDWKSGVKEV